MKTSRWLLLGLGTLMIAPLGGAVTDPSVNPDPGQGVAVIEGTLQHIDPSVGNLTVQDKGGQQVTVRVDKDTRVLDDKNRPLVWTDLKEKDPVHLYYNVRAKRAVLVDRLPTLPETILAPGKS